MGSVSEQPRVVLFDYQFAPNAQKSRNLLNVAGIPYQYCEQPFVLPRPILTDLGITYRRIPVNAMGKDLFCDNRNFIDAVQTVFKDRALPSSPADAAYEAFGYRSFWVCLPLVPGKMITKEMAADRKDLFGVFSRSDYGSLRPSALAELKQLLDVVETEFLSQGKWIGGDRCSIADLHAMWMIKWALQTLDVAQEPGFSKQDFPKVWAWIEGVPAHIPENDVEKLSQEDASKIILGSTYAVKDIGVDSHDPTGLQAGSTVELVTNDDAQGSNHPQRGKLVGLSRREIVIELENSLRLHFPRVGYIIKQV